MPFQANRKVSEVLAELARYLTEDNQKQKALAFLKAANAILHCDRDVANVENLQGIKGVGPSTIALATEIINTGTCERLTELKVRLDLPDLSQLERIPGIGPVKAKKIFGEFGVRTLIELRELVDKGVFYDSKVIVGLEFVERSAEYTPRPWAEAAGVQMIKLLIPFASSDRITFAGSIRRKKALVRDVDILLCCTCAPEEVYEAIRADSRFEVQYGGQQKIRVVYTVYHGNTPDTHIMGGDIVITTPSEWPFALSYLTGSREFNEGVRGHALSKGYTLNEHRLENTTTGERVAGITSEEELFAFLGLSYVPPECRRSREDVGKDFSNILSEMPEGELHTHTDWSDGTLPVMDSVIGASYRFHPIQFYGISDHTKALPHGVAAEDLAEYRKEIIEASDDCGIPVYAGLELDINAAHNIVYPYEAFKNHLDYVILAIHSAIGKEMVARYIAALEQVKNTPAILAHVTGRQFGTRDIPEDDWGKLFKECAKRNVLIELNGQPDRLDPPIDFIKLAKSHGCRFILSSDNHGDHTPEVLVNAYYMARSAGLKREDVIISEKDVDTWMQDVYKSFDSRK